MEVWHDLTYFSGYCVANRLKEAKNEGRKSIAGYVIILRVENGLDQGGNSVDGENSFNSEYFVLEIYSPVVWGCGRKRRVKDLQEGQPEPLQG